MKILLLNDNPVVNKLVTLSAQKTSDELEVVENVDSINEGSYDLLVVDDTLYESELFARLQEKITFNKSLYICARDATSADEFTRTIKKPFLPTDLVELFSTIGKELSEAPEVDELEELNLDMDDLESETLNEAEESPEVDKLEELSLEEFSLEELDLDLDEDLSELDDLGDLEELDSLTSDESTEEVLEGVLDKDDLQEVQDLLDSTEVNEETLSEAEEGSEENKLEELSLEEDLDLAIDDLDLDDDDLEEELTLDIETESEESVEENDLDLELEEEDLELEESSLEKDLDLELDDLEVNTETPNGAEESPKEEVNEETLSETEEGSEENKLEELAQEEGLDLEQDDLDLEANVEIPIEAEESSKENELEELSLEEDLSLESEIEKAVGELSQEDLDSEIDENTLLDMESLSSRDIKLAIGEEVSEVNAETSNEAEKSTKVNELEELSLDENLEIQADNEGVKALKKLLEALSNKDVAASMKGMKISINIELGDN